jgi:hypothetical protein
MVLRGSLKASCEEYGVLYHHDADEFRFMDTEHGCGFCGVAVRSKFRTLALSKWRSTCDCDFGHFQVKIPRRYKYPGYVHTTLYRSRRCIDLMQFLNEHRTPEANMLVNKRSEHAVWFTSAVMR